MRKLYTILTTILYISLSLCLVFALTFSVSAEERTAYFNRTIAIVDPWDCQLGLYFIEIQNTPTYVINPFIEGDYLIDGMPAPVTPITEQYEYYGIVSVLDNGSQNSNANILVGSDIVGTNGAINTISFELCIPCVSSYSELFLTNNFSVNINNKLYYPDSLNVIGTDVYTYVPIMGAPTSTPYTIQAFKFTVYFDTPFEVTAGSYFSMNLPVRAFNFSQPVNQTIGIVWGYSSITYDFYATLDEAQNAHIINSLDKFPNRVKYDDVIDSNESLAGEFSEVQNFEQSLYDNMSFAEGFDQGTADDINYLFGKLDFLFAGWVVNLLLAGISLACISYALYGGS